MVITKIPGISNPTEIAEVDGVGQNLETPQHDGMQRWCDLYPTQPFRRPRGRERERWRGWWPRREERRHVSFVVCTSPSPGPPFI
jgi:hypothetical protein